MQNLLSEMLTYVTGSLIHNGVYLLFGITIAATLKVYVEPEKIKQTLIRRSKTSIPASVTFGAFTPLCACGTMAVIIAMLATTLPWGPVMAFLTSSPLMSPDSFILIAGIIDLKFAIALAVASIIIGLGSGYLTHLIEKKTDFLKDQIRFSTEKKVQTSNHSSGNDAKPALQTCGCSSETDKQLAISTCSCSTETDKQTVVPTCDCSKPDYNNLSVGGSGEICYEAPASIENPFMFSITNRIKYVRNIARKFFVFMKNFKWREIGDAFINIGVKQILFYYTIFVAVGFLINHFVPASIIVSLFSSKNVFAVPLASLIGLPLYVSGESAIPLIQSLMAGGASGGAMLAFLITGPGTSAGVIAGISTIMKRRAVILYVLFILFGGIILGYLYDLFLAMGV